MANKNLVVLIGRITEDPQLKYMPDGRAVLNTSLAINESWRDKTTGEKKEKTEYVRITVYGKQAEIVAQYVAKGSPLYVEGKMQTRKWEKDGQKHYTTEVIVNEFQFLGKKPETLAQARPAQVSAQGGGGQTESADDFNDDIPFVSRFGKF